MIYFKVSITFKLAQGEAGKVERNEAQNSRKYITLGACQGYFFNKAADYMGPQPLLTYD